jgi:hypothetical protein
VTTLRTLVYESEYANGYVLDPEYVASLTDAEVEAIRTVVREDMSFATMFGSGINGERLSVRYVNGDTLLAPAEGDGLEFPNRTAATRFGLLKGYLLEWVRN